MSESTATVENDPSTTIDDLKALIREAEQALSSAGDNASDELRERLREVLADGQSRIRNLTDTLRRRAGAAGDAIRANPYQSIGIATGVGLLAGLLISRSCNGSR
jgi:ElaB protein